MHVACPLNIAVAREFEYIRSSALYSNSKSKLVVFAGITLSPISDRVTAEPNVVIRNDILYSLFLYINKKATLLTWLLILRHKEL
jgi:hypothetical protein